VDEVQHVEHHEEQKSIVEANPHHVSMMDRARLGPTSTVLVDLK
jgi:hypothetical protein